MEEWKDIEGFEGLYKINSMGEVVNKRYQTHSIYLTHKGYQQVSLCKNGVQKSFRLHRLVAQSFIPNPLNLPQVNHKDGNKLNNCVWNLEWCDNKYNSIYSFEIGLQSNIGEANPRCKVKEEDIPIIRKLREDNKSLKDIAKMYNLSLGGVNKICLRKTWKHVI